MSEPTAQDKAKLRMRKVRGRRKQSMLRVKFGWRRQASVDKEVAHHLSKGRDSVDIATRTLWPHQEVLESVERVRAAQQTGAITA